MLIQRRLLIRIRELLKTERLILVEGPPRCGKTTLAEQLHRSGPGSILLDARRQGAAQALAEPSFALDAFLAESPAAFGARTVIADQVGMGEAQAIAAYLRATPESEAARGGLRFVLFGAAFPPIEGAVRLELGPFELFEVGRASRARHWLRGGFPEAFGATSDRDAFAWLGRYAEAIGAERFAEAGLPWAPGRTRALLAMLAEAHGTALNENAVARSLGVSRPTVVRAVTALERMGLLRLFPALGGENSHKRVFRSPTLYFRDSGLLHALLGIANVEGLLGSSRLAASWEGYALEAILTRLPADFHAGRYRTQDGAGLELVVQRAGRHRLGAALCWSRQGQPSRGAQIARRDLGIEEAYLVFPEGEERSLPSGFTALGLEAFLETVLESRL